jgi:hypothetical protein
MFGSRRSEEPPEVTSRLRLYRLVPELEEADEIDRDLVCRIVGEREAVVPLLIGLARGYAREDLCRTKTIEAVPALRIELFSENSGNLCGHSGRRSAPDGLFIRFVRARPSGRTIKMTMKSSMNERVRSKITAGQSWITDCSAIPD